jgi:RHS repeat-associated protein
MTRLRGSRPTRRASLLRATPSRRTPLLACIAGALVAAGLLGLPAGAQAQSSVGLTATPSPFTSGTMIAIEASVAPGANPDSWCFESENCYIVGVLPFLHVYGSNGFYAYADDWSLDVNDPVPGQTMQGATYTAHGGVEWTVCWGFTYCVEYAYSDEEGWSSPATVTPAAPGPPTADWVSPSSGAGPGQIFTVQYSSEGGASYLAELWLVMHPSGGTTNSCVIGYYVAANTVVLWHDSGVGTPEESSGTPGSGTLLSNSQCAVSLSGTSVSTGVSTRTLTVPVAFAPGYHGVQYVYGWAKDGGGVYGSAAVLGNWLARARIDTVMPNPTTVGATVTLTGDGFGASQGGSVAQVNTTPLSVTSWTNTSITATVPPGATSGPVTVVTNGTWSNENVTLGIAGDPPGGADEIIYYHSDALGSVRMITDAAGGMVARYDYLPFGQPFPSDQDAEPRRFGQLERTAGTGNGSWTLLDYALARHYHSQSGRFTTPDDPIFGDPFDPQSMNLYAYARNNPLRFVASGHVACPEDEPACFEVDYGTLRFFWESLSRWWTSTVQEQQAWKEELNRQGLEALLRDCTFENGCFKGASPFTPPLGKLLGPGTKFTQKILGQLAKRGWTPICSNVACPEDEPACFEVDYGTLRFFWESLSRWWTSTVQEQQAWKEELNRQGLEALLRDCTFENGCFKGASPFTPPLGKLLGPGTKFTQKILGQLAKRGWTPKLVQRVIDRAVHTSPAINRATGNPATAYFDRSGSHVVRDNVTGNIVQVSDRLNPSGWRPDSSIVNPFVP